MKAHRDQHAVDASLKALKEAAKGEANLMPYLIDAVKSMNEQQLDVNRMQEKLITDPDSLDIHDVTIAMAKARMSLNLAQTVIDRIVQGWSEITTTR